MPTEDLPDLLALNGSIVTINAAGCQKKVVAKSSPKARTSGAQSLRPAKPDRTHRGIENKLHWTLDVRFRDDDSQVRNENAAQNLNVIRKVAIDLLKADKTTRHTFQKKLRTMMWNDEMLQHIIIGK